ncbi:MAG: hypothetical protein BWY46_01103 [Firmicutes bacterium ADurb.Bin300]|jgi:Gpi18-like mannosyltransferase|nr:MAG: hypothetical protein BWY46_01103 [Firmicutes bacterium ADurb.Bin300]
MGKTEKILKAFVLASISGILAAGLLCCIIVAGENTESIMRGTPKETVSYKTHGKNPFDFLENIW